MLTYLTFTYVIIIKISYFSKGYYHVARPFWVTISVWTFEICKYDISIPYARWMVSIRLTLKQEQSNKYNRVVGTVFPPRRRNIKTNKSVRRTSSLYPCVQVVRTVSGVSFSASKLDGRELWNFYAEREYFGEINNPTLEPKLTFIQNSIYSVLFLVLGIGILKTGWEVKLRKHYFFCGEFKWAKHLGEFS